MRKLLLTAVLLISLLNQAGGGFRVAAEARNDVTFTIDPRVSAEDLAYVQEGIRLAQDYLLNDLGVTPDDATIVNVRATAAPMNLGEVGESAGDYIALFTRSAGWRLASPALRIGVVIHEFVHTYQTDQTDGDPTAAPLWLIEGTAEYLATDALVSRGLLSQSSAESFRYWSLTSADSLEALAAYEAIGAYQSADARVYDLAYLGVQQLVAAQGIASLVEFFELIGDGQKWGDAFAAAFAIEPEEFYAEFEADRDEFIQPANMPAAYKEIDPHEWSSPGRITELPDTVEAGDQLIMIGRSVPNSRCIFYLTGESIDRMHETTADGAANFFWLVTIPEDAVEETAELSVDCGNGESITPLKIRA